MRNSLLLVTFAAGMALLGYLLGRDDARPAPTRAAPRTATASPEVLSRLDLLERRLSGLKGVEAELARLRAQMAQARIDDERPERAAPVAAQPIEPVREEDPRFRELSSAQLRARAMAHSKEPGVEAIDHWYAFLRRDLPADERADALGRLAHVHRKLDDYRSAARLFREAIDHAGGRNSAQGQGHSHSLAWALSFDGDHAGALDEVDRLLEQPDLTDAVEASARSMSAGLARRLGDTGRARRELQILVDSYSRSPAEHFRRIAERAAERLADLG